MSKLRLAAFALLLFSPLAANAQGLTGYNVFTFGGFSQMNTEVNGTLAVGGSFSSVNGGFGSLLTAPQPKGSLVVAGSAAITGGTFKYGDVYIAGARALNNVGGTNLILPQGTALPVDFQSEYSRLYSYSTALAATAPTATVTAQYSQLFFYGTGMTNIFTVTQAQLAAAQGGYNFYAPSGASIIVNVTGFGGGATLFNNTGFNFCSFASSATNFSGCSQPSQNETANVYSKLLWNLSSAAPTSVAFAGSMRGSFLAPNVDINATYGSCVGDFVARTITSNCEFYQNSYTGYLPATTTSTVPEPTSMLLTAAGMAVIALTMRNRRKRTVA